MTGFDLGDPAPDADEESDDESVPSNESPAETPSTNETTETSSSNETKTETTDTTTASVSTAEPTSDQGDDRDHERDPTETGPAFPYSEVRQSPLYARDETWTTFEDELDCTVTPALRQMGIRDDELREIHEVALEIVLDNLEEIPERLAENRRQS